MLNLPPPYDEALAVDEIATIVSRLLALPSDEARLKVFHEFCRHCGTPLIPCYCMRDE